MTIIQALSCQSVINRPVTLKHQHCTISSTKLTIIVAGINRNRYKKCLHCSKGSHTHTTQSLYYSLMSVDDASSFIDSIYPFSMLSSFSLRELLKLFLLDLTLNNLTGSDIKRKTSAMPVPAYETRFFISEYVFPK